MESWSPFNSRTESKLLVKSPPVPKPCGIFGFLVKVYCAIEFKPILLSSAEVIHQPISRFSAKEIHSSVPENPPTKEGFRIIN